MQTIIFTDVLSPGFGRNAGAYRIATQLRNNGYTCQVIDHCVRYTQDEYVKIIDKFVTKDTLWVGISNTFFFPLLQEGPADGRFNDVFDKVFGKISDFRSGFPFESDTMQKLFWYIRSKNENVKIIVGGARSKEALRYDAGEKGVFADYYVHGYADEAIVELTNWLRSNKSPRPKLDIIHKSIIDSNRDYPYQHFNNCDIKYIKEDLISPDEYLPIEIARGCIFKCKFCSFSLLGKKRGDYTKTKETLINEFMYNYETFGTTNYMFMDETTNDSMEKAEYLLDVTSSLPFKIRWGGYARLDLHYANPDMAAIMKESGQRHTQFGIETFNHQSGKAIGKGLDPEKIKKTLEKLKHEWKNDVRITTGLIVGLPYETRQTLKDLENYLLSDDCNLDAWVLHPLLLVEESLFGEDPAKYGYTFEQGSSQILNWKNSEMNFDEAVQIVTEIRNNTKHKCKLNTWSHMRLQNIGYTESEIDSMNTETYLSTMSTIAERMTLKKDSYFLHLMAL